MVFHGIHYIGVEHFVQSDIPKFGQHAPTHHGAVDCSPDILTRSNFFSP